GGRREGASSWPSSSRSWRCSGASAGSRRRSSGSGCRPRHLCDNEPMTADLRRKLKELLIERLKFEDMTPDDIADDEPLFAGGLGLDSIDALEIVVMLESEFGIRMKNETSARDNFRTVAALAEFVEQRTAEQQPQA